MFSCVAVHEKDVDDVAGVEYIIPRSVCRCNVGRAITDDAIQANRAEDGGHIGRVIGDIIKHSPVRSVGHRIE